ncbi:alpha/beta fold hydrolase [Kutzneria buriramensis]|uniref:Pimeloyl-ACP methyl ester carboxylesterase n=1 Tax=Kutzneria buriramensis TaxID=1045776 RepID=A0A3E0H4Z5_9PSEU|nr:alpha/beta hydrolase [Kutzneria buriramensis]REH37247.1 pimeloyl-ACP methyl ester carboxylesterase [Kutzneria buriramensis]
MESLTITLGEHVFDALAAGPADGEFVLLLHGYPEFADCWTEELVALGEAGYRAVAVDQRGYSPGARPTEIADYVVDNLVADALGFADSQDAHRFHLVCHDWGGIVGWALAGAHSDRLRSFTVLATPHPQALHAAIASDQEQYDKLDYVRFFRSQVGGAEQAILGDNGDRLRAAYGGAVSSELVERNVKRLSEPGALTAALSWYRAVATDDLDIPAGRVSAPTLYLWGSEDRALGRTAAEATAAWVDGPYEFVEFTGASHWLPEEAADRVIPLLLAHLAANKS